MQQQWRRSEKRKDGMKLSLPPKLVKKLVWVPPVISFCKIFIPSYGFDALLCRNWPFSAPNRLALRITLFVFPDFQTFQCIERSIDDLSKSYLSCYCFQSFSFLDFSSSSTHISSSHNLLFALNFVAFTYQELKISFLSISSIILFS